VDTAGRAGRSSGGGTPVWLRYVESFEARNAAMTVISPNLLLDDGTNEP
jgi:hypothetical protein